MNNQIVIKSLPDLECIIEKLLEDGIESFSVDDIRFELPEIKIHFNDSGHSGCIDGELMAIFTELQRKIYKDFGYLIYNKDKMSKLSREEKEALLIRVQVEKGSIIDKIDIGKFLSELVKKMDSKDIVKVFRFIVLACCIVGISNHAISSITQYKIKKNDTAETVSILAHYDNLSSRLFDYLSEKESVSINGEKLSSDTLMAISNNKKALAKSLMSGECSFVSVSGNFFVQEFKNEPEYSVCIRDVETGIVYKACLGYETTPEIKKLINLLSNKNEYVSMELTVILDSRGKPIDTVIDKLDGKIFSKDLFSIDEGIET